MLLVSYTPVDQGAGAAARWQSFAAYLAELGWDVETISATRGISADPGARVGRARLRTRARSALMSAARRATTPFWRALGLRPPPLSTLWFARGALSVRRRVSRQRFDIVLATGPQMSALLAARLALLRQELPLILEFRDLWAGNDAYDAGGRLLPALERRLCAGAGRIIVTCEEAALSLRSRLHESAPPIDVVANGFEPDLLAHPTTVPGRRRPIRIIHAGTLVAGRPLSPLLQALAVEPYRTDFELILLGHAASEARRELAAVGPSNVQLAGPVGRSEAIESVAAADVGLILQGRGVGDETAIAAKVFEYLALGRPVLCISSGGATERLLGDLGAADYCARLDRPETITRALALLRNGLSSQPPPEALAAYRRDQLAHRLDESLRAALRDKPKAR